MSTPVAGKRKHEETRLTSTSCDSVEVKLDARIGPRDQQDTKFLERLVSRLDALCSKPPTRMLILSVAYRNRAATGTEWSLENHMDVTPARRCLRMTSVNQLNVSRVARARPPRPGWTAACLVCAGACSNPAHPKEEFQCVVARNTTPVEVGGTSAEFLNACGFERQTAKWFAEALEAAKAARQATADGVVDAKAAEAEAAEAARVAEAHYRSQEIYSKDALVQNTVIFARNLRDKANQNAAGTTKATVQAQTTAERAVVEVGAAAARAVAATDRELRRGFFFEHGRSQLAVFQPCTNAGGAAAHAAAIDDALGGTGSAAALAATPIDPTCWRIELRARGVDLKALVDEADGWGDKLEEAGATLWEGPRSAKPVAVRAGGA